MPGPPVAVRYNTAASKFEQIAIDTSLFGAEDRFVDVSPVPGSSERLGGRQALLRARERHRQGQGRADRRARRNHAGHLAGQRRRAGKRAGRRRDGHRRSVDGHLGGLAVPLHERDRPARRHRPQLGRARSPSARTSRSNSSSPTRHHRTTRRCSRRRRSPIEQATSLETPVPEVIPALLKDIRVSRRGLTVIVSFKLAGLADVQLVAKRHGKTIARTAKERLKAGKHSLKLSFSAKRWPTGLSFKTKALVKLKPVPATGCENSPGSSGAPGAGPNAVATSCEAGRPALRARGRTRSRRACADELPARRPSSCRRCRGGGAARAARPLVRGPSRRGRRARGHGRERSPAPARARNRRREHRPDGRRDRRRSGRSVGLQGAAARRAAARRTPPGAWRSPPPSGGSPPGQLVFERATDADSNWTIQETPLNEEGQPYRGMQPDRPSARITPHGGGLLAGEDSTRAVGQAGRRARTRSWRALSRAARTVRGRAARKPAKAATPLRGRLPKATGRAPSPTRRSKAPVTPKRSSARSGVPRTRA